MSSLFNKKKTKQDNHVLIVDDNKYAALALQELLGKDGYDVDVAYDGETALIMARDADPDVIVLDIKLPGKSGYDVARILKQELHSSALLIALTGLYGRAEDKRKAREAGFDHHLIKPILTSEIEELIDAPRTPVESK